MPKKPRQLSPFEEKLNTWVTDHLSRVPTKHKILFVYHLQIMTKAGLSIIQSLKILSEETENKKLKGIIGEVKKEVESGKTLSETLKKYHKVFPSIYVSMIEAGEASGKLEEALEQVANQMKKNQALTSKVKGAMVYPAVVLVAMVGIGLEVVLFVLPKLMVMFEETEAELPWSTKVLMTFMNFMQDYGILVIVLIIAAVIGFGFSLRLPKVKRAVHLFNLHIPIFGKIIKKINLARFTLTLSSLLNSSIPIIQAMQITSDVVGNVIYREKLKLAGDALQKGENLSKILAKNKKIFPPMVTEMIMVGEETGQIEEMLGEMSEYYTNEVDDIMRNFSIIIEPVIILILGGAVAIIAAAVIMPMYSLAQSF